MYHLVSSQMAGSAALPVPTADDPDADGARNAPSKLVDVARLAGVSKATASKALNNRSDVRPATRRRVQDAARRLAFTHREVTRSAFDQRVNTVGVLTNDLEDRFVLPMLAGTEDTLAAGDISVILCNARGNAIREARHLKALIDRGIDGLIVMGGAHTDERPSLGQDLPLPVVYAYAPSSDASDSSVTPDNVGAGRMAAEHLWTTGRRKIAYIGRQASYIASAERERGAKENLAERGAELVGSGLSQGHWTEKWGRIATTRLLTEVPDIDGIIGASDGIARASLDILRDNNRSVPSDVGVIGFDNWNIIVTSTRPELTSIDMNLPQLGAHAASMIFSALSGQSIGIGVERLPVSLVVRNSTVPDQ